MQKRDKTALLLDALRGCFRNNPALLQEARVQKMAGGSRQPATCSPRTGNVATWDKRARQPYARQLRSATQVMRRVTLTGQAL